MLDTFDDYVDAAILEDDPAILDIPPYYVEIIVADNGIDGWNGFVTRSWNNFSTTDAIPTHINHLCDLYMFSLSGVFSSNPFPIDFDAYGHALIKSYTSAAVSSRSYEDGFGTGFPIPADTTSPIDQGTYAEPVWVFKWDYSHTL
jgi:hypothetical protein